MELKEQFIDPEVKLLDNTLLAVSELGARICYDSLKDSKNISIESFRESKDKILLESDDNDLVYKITNEFFHGSIMEHTVLNFYINNIPRGVLTELSRHRIASFSVRSTRYTMANLLKVFYIIKRFEHSIEMHPAFEKYVREANIFTVQGVYLGLEIKQLLEKLDTSYESLGKDRFASLALSKSTREFIDNEIDRGIEYLLKLFKSNFKEVEELSNKRNAGDTFKWIVTDTWRTELVFTINLRSFQNLLKLRDSGSAWLPIHRLAEEMLEETPELIRPLVSKRYKKPNQGKV